MSCLPPELPVRQPVRRPRLRPGLAALWRDPATVQFGTDGPATLLIGDIGPAAADVLRHLDGTRDLPQVLAAGGEPAAALLALLDDAGCLEDAGRVAPVPPGLAPLDDAAQARLRPERAALALSHRDDDVADALIARRRQTRVLVVGGGRLGTTLAHLLAASGMGRVRVEDPARVETIDPCPGGARPEDVGLLRAAAAAALILRAAPPALDDAPADLVALCAPAAPASVLGAYERGAATLPVIVREGAVRVGPLHDPADHLTTGCPDCEVRHRGDRDPAWPDLARQLAAGPDPGEPVAAAALVWAAVAAAAGQILRWSDRRELLARGRPGGSTPPTAGASLELDALGNIWQRRWWGPHPECPCRDRPTESSADPSARG